MYKRQATYQGPLDLAFDSQGNLFVLEHHSIRKIEFSGESKEFLDGEELSVAKEMIRAGIESVSGNSIDFDDFFDSQKKSLRKKPVTLH